MEHYFDFYSWLDTSAVGGLTPLGRIKSPGLTGGNRMLTLLISGPQGCGRSSLKNLLLFELIQQAAQPPIVVEWPVTPSINRAQNMVSLARKLAQTAQALDVGAGTALNTVIADWQKDQLVGQEPDIDYLFAQLRQDLQIHLPSSPVVVSLEALSHTLSRDTAYATSATLESVADFVVLSLTNTDDAKIVRTSCINNGRPVALIEAPKVDLDTAKRLLSHHLRRLRAEAAADELFPFTEPALAVLFAGTDARVQPSVSLPIRVALQKLSAALTNKCQPGGGPPGPITAADMRATLGV